MSEEVKAEKVVVRLQRAPDNQLFLAIADHLGGGVCDHYTLADGEGVQPVRIDGKQVSPKGGWACINPGRVIEAYEAAGFQLASIQVTRGVSRSDKEYLAMVRTFTRNGDQFEVSDELAGLLERVDGTTMSYLHCHDNRETPDASVSCEFCGTPKPHKDSGDLPKKVKALLS